MASLSQIGQETLVVWRVIAGEEKNAQYLFTPLGLSSAALSLL